MSIILAPPSGPSIVLKEMWDGFEKGVDTGRGPWVKKLYLADDWGTTDAAINALTGAGVLAPPHRCPDSPNLFCLSAQAVGVGEYDDHAGSRPKWRKGVIEATYAIPPYATSSDSNAPPQFINDAGGGGGPFLFMEQSIDWDTEVYKLPDSSFAWQDDSTPVDVPAAVSIAVAEFVVVRKFQAALPYLNMANYLGRLNNNVLFGQAKGRLQLRKVGTKAAYQSDGSSVADITYRFKWREVDHNMLFKPSKGDFEYVVNKQNKMMYKYANIGQVLV